MQQIKLENIQQRKGEAEMSQMDWLVHISSSLEATDEVVLVVTSGDIDAIPIQLFALTTLWPRKDDNSFRNKVHV